MALSILDEGKAHSTMSRLFMISLEWRADSPVSEGAFIELRCLTLRAFFTWKISSVVFEDGDVTELWNPDAAVSEYLNNPKYMIAKVRLRKDIPEGTACRITITAKPLIWSSVEMPLYIFQPDNPGPARGLPRDLCSIAAAPGPVERLSLYCRPAPNPDGTVRACVIPEDRFGNPSSFEQPVTVDFEWDGREWTQTILSRNIINLDAPSRTARLRAAIPMAALSLNENIIDAVADGSSLVVFSNNVLPESPLKGLLPAFGEIHWHTKFSGDGCGDMDDALLSARDDLNMDFAAPGDHNPSPDQWRHTVAALESINEDDVFATFFGWENGTLKGHENYYFTDPQHPLRCHGEAGLITGYPADIADKLSSHNDFFAVPHHTNAISEAVDKNGELYWGTYPWGKPARYIRLVEIMQLRGNQERNEYTDAWRGWNQNGASAQDALALGHKIGFTGGTDNHCARPGRAFSELAGPGRHNPKSVILTGVWTPRVERHSIFNSLAARHTWAVWDTRAIVLFTVNGVLMGGELEAAEGEHLAASLKIWAEGPLQSVEIISDGLTVWSASFASNEISEEIPLGTASKNTHFYMRALQRNGGIIYASPVFVTIETQNNTGAAHLTYKLKSGVINSCE